MRLLHRIPLDIDLIVSFHIGIFYRKTWLATFRAIKRDTRDAVKRLDVKGGSQKISKVPSLSFYSLGENLRRICDN